MKAQNVPDQQKWRPTVTIRLEKWHVDERMMLPVCRGPVEDALLPDAEQEDCDKAQSFPVWNRIMNVKIVDLIAVLAVADLREQRAASGRKYDEMKASGKDAWDSTNDGFESAGGEVEKSYENVKAKYF